MEDSFKLRVERLFGSRLFDSVPKSSFPDSSWSVTDGEVEKKEWNREAAGSFPGREDMPCASAFEECLPKNGRRSGVPKRHRFEDELDDGEEEEIEEEAGEEEDGGDVEREEREIRSSIGLDPTLDYEEEEDEYDRAAVGNENATERIYMRDVNDHGPYVNYHTVIEDSGEELLFARDPRADRLAACTRLEEDKETGKCFPRESRPSVAALNPETMEGGVNLKPILKRKGEQMDARPKKQVRFGLGCKDPCRPNDSRDFSTVVVPEATEAPGSADSSGLPPEDSPNVPDYVRNPSRYVRYTFDPEDGVSDVSNRRAFDDFWSIARGSKIVEADGGVTEPPKSVIFTPRKRAADPVPTGHHSSRRQDEDALEEESWKESAHSAIRSVGIAVAEAQENEVVCAMEEDPTDIPVEKSVGSQKSFRQYRSRAHPDDSAR